MCRSLLHPQECDGILRRQAVGDLVSVDAHQPLLSGSPLIDFDHCIFLERGKMSKENTRCREYGPPEVKQMLSISAVQEMEAVTHG